MRSAAAITGGDSCLLAKTCAPGRAVRSDDGADSAGGCNALASRLPLQGPRVDPNLLLVARDSPLRTATTAPDSPARDDDTPLLPLRYAIRLDGGEHSSGRDRPRHGDHVDHDDNNDMDEPPITAASTGKPPIRLACLAGARPGRIRRGSSDLDAAAPWTGALGHGALLTRVSICGARVSISSVCLADARPGHVRRDSSDLDAAAPWTGALGHEALLTRVSISGARVSISEEGSSGLAEDINLLDAGSDYNGKDEQPITASSTGKPPIRRLACLAGARPGRVRRGSSDLDLLTRVSISEDIDPNLHTPTKDTVIPFADPNPMTPPSPPAMHLPPQESPTPELKQPPLPMTPGDDERSTARLQAIPPDTIPSDLSTTSSTSTPLLCAVCCVLSAGCDLPYAATPPTHTPPPLVLFSNIPGERVVKRVRPPTWLTLSRPPRLACAG